MKREALNEYKYTPADDIIKAYSYLSGAIVTTDGKAWEVSTPEATLYFDTTRELMLDLAYNLECMRECIEPELWREAWEQ